MKKIRVLEKKLAKSLEKEESHIPDEKEKKEESEAEERLRAMQTEMEEKIREKDKQLYELEQRQLEEKSLKEKEIEEKQREVESAKQEASALQSKISDLSSEKEKAEQEIRRIKKELEAKEGDSRNLTMELEKLSSFQSELQGKLKEEKEAAQKAEQKIIDAETALKELRETKDSLVQRTEALAMEKTALEEQKSSLETQNREMTEKFEQEKEEKMRLEEKTKELEPRAAYWDKVKDLLAIDMESSEAEKSSAAESSALAVPSTPLSVDAATLQAICLRLEQLKAIQRREREQVQTKPLFEIVPAPQPYADYESVRKLGEPEKTVSQYELNDMQSMLVYRKPLLIFSVIKDLLNELGELNKQVRSRDAKSKGSSSISSSSSSMFSSLSQNRLKVKIHNIQVTLCYFFLYNAPLHFLVEQAKEFSKKNQPSIQNSWNILQMIEGEFPGLDKIWDIIEQESAKQDQEDNYESYYDFVKSRDEELTEDFSIRTKLKDRDGTSLFDRYKEKSNTFKWHQLAGLIKLFESKNITDLFGDSNLVGIFIEELRTQLRSYRNAYKSDSNQPIMDVDMQDGKLQWINAKIPSSVNLKK